MREWMPLMGTSLAIHMRCLNEEFAQANHAQSLDRLAERGGLAPSEALAILERRRVRSWRMDTERDLKALIELTTQNC